MAKYGAQHREAGRQLEIPSSLQVGKSHYPVSNTLRTAFYRGYVGDMRAKLPKAHPRILAKLAFDASCFDSFREIRDSYLNDVRRLELYRKQRLGLA